jgi:energy-coupling factor transporter ATP-binding protein EcfA2
MITSCKTKVSDSALDESRKTKLQKFQGLTLAHPQLLEAKDKLLAAIQESPPNSLVMVFGPTGVGKTTLLAKVEQILAQSLLCSLQTDRGRIPVVSVEAVAPESGNFNWRDQFKRTLLKMEEPLVECKLPPPVPRGGDDDLYARRSLKTSGAEYRYAVEQALRHRRPLAVLIDEAQHLVKLTSGRKLLDQLDVIKSIANLTGTVHVLFGTYDLLAFHNLNGQLSRRCAEIHFRRYRADQEGDRRSFVNTVHSFAQRMPFSQPPDLAVEWEFLYERSVGCVGVLKDWLVRGLVHALKREKTSLNRSDLEPYALSVSQCERMLSEAMEGELRLRETADEQCRLRTRLGLATCTPGEEGLSADSGSRRHRGARPGQRRPMRDKVGRSTLLDGNHS